MLMHHDPHKHYDPSPMTAIVFCFGVVLLVLVHLWKCLIWALEEAGWKEKHVVKIETFEEWKARTGHK